MKTNILKGNLNQGTNIRTYELIARRYNLITFEEIECAVRKTLGLNIKSVVPVLDGIGALVYFLSIRNQKPLLLKVSLFSDHHSVVDEYLFALFVQKNLRSKIVPKIYVLDLSCSIIKYPYLIREWRPGQTLLSFAYENPRANLTSYLITIGCFLRQFHNSELSIHGYGRLSSKYISSILKRNRIIEPIVGSFNKAKQYYLSDIFSQIEFLAISTKFSKHDINHLYRLVNSLNVKIDKPVIQHGDPSMRNFIFKNSTLTAVIDGSAKIGAGYEEIANTYVFLYGLTFSNKNFNPTIGFESLMKGYGLKTYELLNDQMFNFFVIRKLLNRICTTITVRKLKEFKLYINLLRNRIFTKSF